MDQLIRVKRKDRKNAADTLALAFMKDPLSCWFFKDKKTRLAYLQDYFFFRVGYGLKFGEIYTTSDEFEGVAMWIPGKNAEMTFWRGLRSGGMILMSMVKEMWADFNHVGHYTAEFRNKLIQPPYFQLSPIGVKPEYQGKGFGSRLLRPILERFDREQTICFLETQTESNLPIYKKLGFKIVDESRIPKVDLIHWGMIREPIKK